MFEKKIEMNSYKKLWQNRRGLKISIYVDYVITYLHILMKVMLCKCALTFHKFRTFYLYFFALCQKNKTILWKSWLCGEIMCYNLKKNKKESWKLKFGKWKSASILKSMKILSVDNIWKMNVTSRKFAERNQIIVKQRFCSLFWIICVCA